MKALFTDKEPSSILKPRNLNRTMAKKKKKDHQRKKSRFLNLVAPVPGAVRAQIEKLLTDDRPDEALVILEEWLEKRPDHPLLSFYAGSAHAMQGRPGTALRYYRTAYRGDRRNESLLNNLLYVYLKLGFTTHALRILQSYMETGLAFEQGDLSKMSELQAEIGKFQREVADHFGIPVDRFEEAHYWDEECQIAQQEGDWSGSISAANKALSILPDHPPVLNNRAMSYYFAGRLEEAIADEERALALDAVNVHTLTNLIRFHYFRGEQAAVESYFSRLQALSPEDWRHQSSPIAKMMEAYAVAGTDEEIHAFLREYAAEEPARGSYMLGAAAANLGEKREARRLWKKVKDDGSGWKSLAEDALSALADGKPGMGRADHFPYLTYHELLSGSQLQLLLDVLDADSNDKQAQQRTVGETAARHPGLLAAARWFLWYGPRASDGIQMLVRLGTEEAFAALREFALGTAGTDAERLEATRQLDKAGQRPPDDALDADTSP